MIARAIKETEQMDLRSSVSARLQELNLCNNEAGRQLLLCFQLEEIIRLLTAMHRAAPVTPKEDKRT